MASVRRKLVQRWGTLQLRHTPRGGEVEGAVRGTYSPPARTYATARGHAEFSDTAAHGHADCAQHDATPNGLADDEAGLADDEADGSDSVSPTEATARRRTRCSDAARAFYDSAGQSERGVPERIYQTSRQDVRS